MSQFKYRPEIDGLRAIAVLPVVLFHANLGFTGGYVGVDVFFVISGYLISALILKEMEAKTFSMGNFWERRIRRIFPAALAMVAVTIIAAWFLLLPSQSIVFGRSVWAQAVMLANVRFWRNSGYFSGEAETNPLLHTWSLAVEEQFYVVFPIALFILVRYWRKLLLPSVIVMIILSLAAAVVMMSRDSMAAFFLLPFRAWELLAGTLLAVLPMTFMPKKGAVREILGWLGLGLILWPVFAYQKDTSFPGFTAIPPVLGAALVIFSNGGEAGLNTIGKLLTNRFLRFIGAISYSLYLWHWPVMAFVRYVSPHDLTPAQGVLTIAASFVLGILSWRFVERPFRNRDFLPGRNRIFVIAGALTAAVVAIGFCFQFIDRGLRFRFDDHILAIADGDVDRGGMKSVISQKRLDRGELTRLGALDVPAKLMIIGDSHALASSGALDRICAEKGVGLFAAMAPAQPPFVDTWSTHVKREKGVNFIETALKLAKEKGVTDLLLVARWTLYTRNDHHSIGDTYFICDDELTATDQQSAETVFRRGFERTLATAREAGIRLWVMREVPGQDVDVPRSLGIRTHLGMETASFHRTEEDYRELTTFADALFEEFAGPDLQILDPSPLLIDESGQYYPAGRNGRAMYFDDDHLSDYGAELIREVFVPFINAAQASSEL